MPLDDGSLPIHYALAQRHDGISHFFLEESRKQGRLEEVLNMSDEIKALPIHLGA